MNTKSITDFIGGSWRRELGKDPKNSTHKPVDSISLKVSKLDVAEEYRDKLEANWHKDD